MTPAGRCNPSVQTRFILNAGFIKNTRKFNTAGRQRPKITPKKQNKEQNTKEHMLDSKTRTSSGSGAIQTPLKIIWQRLNSQETPGMKTTRLLEVFYTGGQSGQSPRQDKSMLQDTFWHEYLKLNQEHTCWIVKEMYNLHPCYLSLLPKERYTHPLCVRVCVCMCVLRMPPGWVMYAEWLGHVVVVWWVFKRHHLLPSQPFQRAQE